MMNDVIWVGVKISHLKTIKTHFLKNLVYISISASRLLNQTSDQSHNSVGYCFFIFEGHLAVSREQILIINKITPHNLLID